MPGAFEGETVSRRSFMTRSVHAAGAIAAAAFTLPALGFAIGPLFDRAGDTWQDIGPLSLFADSTYAPVVITIEPGIGEAGKSTAYIRKHNLDIDGPVKDQYDHVIAISTRGIRTGGPPPRPLDRFYTLIRAGRVLVGPRFSVNSELRRFAPRDPGQALDGIGQFLYPARFSTPRAPPGTKP
jgi:menaquinol-cytochrome c reductase iron-sulfur subunit